MKKKQVKRYNDGVIKLYREAPKRSSFNAKQNVSALDDMEFVVKLAYEEVSKREQDQEFADQNDFSLSLKIKTRCVKNVDNKCKAVIDGWLYDVKYVDKTKTEIYFYLEEVRKIDS